jgi:Ni/Co efflux regulator RcnB
VAHQLEVSVRDIEQFKRQNALGDEDAPEGASGAPDYPDEIDLRAEDDALIAAELEAAELAAEQARAEARERGDREDDDDEADDEDAPRPRTRRRRGGRGRRVLGSRSGRGGSGPLEGTFDHGEEGYGLWLDPAIQDDPIYAEHWAGHRSVEVIVDEERIVIRRVGDDD